MRPRDRRVPIVACVALALGVARGTAFAEEPGVAAVESARAAVATLARAAAKPTPGTTALGSSFLDLATVGAPLRPTRSDQSVDSAAQPFLVALEPRLAELRERILDRRHRFLTGDDRPPAPKPDFATAVYDIRSLARLWQPPSVRGEPPLPSVATAPEIEARPIQFSPDKLRDMVDAWGVGQDGREGGWVTAQDGSLIVRAPRADQERIRGLLDGLRGLANRRLAVSVSAYRLTRATWREHAGARSAEDAERVLSRALAAKTATLLVSRTAVIDDGEVAHFEAGSSRRFLAGIEENETGVVPVLNPVVGRVDLGLHGDVRATTAPSGGEAYVDVDLELRDLVALERETVQEHDLDLPKTLVTRCATTLTASLGRAVLAGGTFAGSEEAASACAFSVRVAPFGRPPRLRALREAPAKEPGEAHLAPSPRPEVVELDALLALVDDALAKVREARRYELEVFDVRDLLEGPHGRSAPTLGLDVAGAPKPAAGMAGATLTFGDDMRGTPEGPLGLPPERLEAVIKNTTGADEAWGDPASYELHWGELLVHQTPGELSLVARRLATLRKDRTGDFEVEVEWLRAEDGLVRELGRSGAALGADAVARLDSEAASGVRVRRVASGFVVAERGDTAVLHGGRESTYVAAFEHGGGGTGQVVETVAFPRLGETREGLAVEVLGHGVATGGEGALAVDARLGLARIAETVREHTPSGSVAAPVVDESRAAFQGLAPGGALLLAAGRRQGEARPELIVLLRGRLLPR